MAAQRQYASSELSTENSGFDPAFNLIRAVPFSWHVDQEKMICDHPDQLARLLDAPANTHTIPSNSISALFPETVQSQRKAAIADLTWDGARYILSYQLRTFTGDLIWIEESGERQNGNAGSATHIRGILRDVSETRRSQTALILEDRRDRLTGLLSARAFKEIYDHERRVGEHRTRLPAVIRLALTNLGDINDTFGYRAGDEGIKICAGALADAGLSNAAMGRIKGDVFLAMCWMDKDAVERLCNEIENALFSAPVSTGFGDLSLTGSIDVYPMDAPIVKSMMDAVKPLAELDLAATAVKIPGQAINSEKKQTGFTKKQVEKLIVNRNLLLAYQPIVDANSLETQHYECLLRTQKPDGEIVSAWPVIQAAERFDIIGKIDRFVLEQAISTLSTHPELCLAVNVSAGTVKDPQASPAYLNVLEGSKSLARRLIIELTETLALENSDQANAFAARARSLGCRFAIDDFGAGHTSFRHLLNIEADTIKIDGAFVRDIALHDNKQTFVRLIVDLAQTLGVETIAEMVDNPSDAKFLKHLGVDKLQGFLFGYPGALPA